MEVRFEPVRTPEQITYLAALADLVWHEYFPALLKKEQIDYMVDKFQSAEAIEEQMAGQGYEYYLIAKGEETAGYIGIRPDKGKLFLSKLYLKKEHRKRGYASQAFAFLEKLCAERKLCAIWLTVNRFNEDTIKVYRKKGYRIVREQEADIGNGFVMDDYVMEKEII